MGWLDRPLGPLRPPVLADPEATRQAAVLVPALWLTSAILAATVLLRVVVGSAPPLALVAVGVVCAALLWLIRCCHAGRVRAAGIAALVVGMCGFLASNLAQGGLHPPVTGAYVLVPPVAGFVFGVRGAILTGLGGIAAIVLVGALQAAGALRDPFPVETSAYVLVCSSQVAVALLVTALALRRVRAALEEARAAAEQLERRVQERTRDLVAARDQALAASRAKSAFLANMSHELRTPMNGVLGIVDLMLMDEVDPDKRDLLETVHKSGRVLVGVVDDILHLAKIEAGRLDVESEPFDPAAVAREVRSLLSASAAAKGLALTVVDQGAPEEVRGDRRRFSQVLTNLVTNALKFTDAGSVRVEIGRGATADGERLLVRVVDTGPGLSEEQRARLFLPFSQVDSSTTRRHGGTGLGLSICRGLVEAMGGEIGVQGAPGRGSCFWFVLPTGDARQPRLGFSAPSSTTNDVSRNRAIASVA